VDESVESELGLFLDHPGTGAGATFLAARQIVQRAHDITTSLTPLAVLLLNEAQDEEPVSQTDGYHWLFTVLSGGLVADVDLRGRARGNVDAVWDMLVSSSTTSPPLTDFLLLSGTSDLFAENGKWRLFDEENPAASVPLLDISWSNIGLNGWRVTFRNIRDGNENEGDYLDFETLGDLRRVTYYDASADQRSFVDWNATTSAGQLVSPTHNSNVPSCWNNVFANVACGG
jgi:hypothetical protein